MPVVDAISMNSMVIDVSAVPEARPGDEVVLFGSQDGVEISAGELESANRGILADLYTVWAKDSRILVADTPM